jgi:hypothetical protein
MSNSLAVGIACATADKRKTNTRGNGKRHEGNKVMIREAVIPPIESDAYRTKNQK